MLYSYWFSLIKLSLLHMSRVQSQEMFVGITIFVSLSKAWGMTISQVASGQDSSSGQDAGCSRSVWSVGYLQEVVGCTVQNCEKLCRTVRNFAKLCRLCGWWHGVGWQLVCRVGSGHTSPAPSPVSRRRNFHPAQPSQPSPAQPSYPASPAQLVVYGEMV